MTHDELDALRKRTGIDEGLATDAAAALIGKKPQTLRAWACKGTGPIRPRRVGGRLVWPLADLKEIMGAT